MFFRIVGVKRARPASVNGLPSSPTARGVKGVVGLGGCGPRRGQGERFLREQGALDGRELPHHLALVSSGSEDRPQLVGLPTAAVAAVTTVPSKLEHFSL